MTEAIFSQFAALLAAALLIPSFIFLAYGVNHRHMRFWWTAALAYFLIFFGSLLAATRSYLPELVVVVLANALIGLGYYWSLRAVRMVKSCWTLPHFDLYLTALYLVALVLVVGFSNTYPARVALISAFILVVSITASVVTFRCSTRVSILGDVALIIFGIGNSTFSLMRGTTALLDIPNGLLSFGLWDQVFFIWSIAAVFCFAIGLFLNGTALISAETHRALEKERSLTEALTEALESQRNLQKLILHELKRPLNNLSTAIERARKSEDAMPQDDIARLHDLTKVANTYLHDIAEYEDIHALFDQPNLTQVKVSRLIDDIRRKWSVPVEPQGDVESATLSVDLLLFDVAIGNLIENAQKFGRSKAGVAVTVQARSGYVIFNVADDGDGIPSREAKKVFQQFYKSDQTGANAVLGCGLGLYVVHRIAMAHGGSSRVASQKPSVLRLSFPLLSDLDGKNV